MIELQLLNAVLASRDASALVRNGLLDKSHWATQKAAYKYIKKHLDEYGELPSQTSVVANAEEFEAMEVSESPDVLAKKLIERNIKQAQREFLTSIAKEFGDLDAYQILAKMEKAVDGFQRASIKRGRDGMDWAASGSERLAEFERRKVREFNRTIDFMFEELTQQLGAMNPGFYLSIMGFTSRGKSWLGILQALAAHKGGNRVLIESGEMSKPEVSFRLDTLAGGFSNRGLLTGGLDFRSEEEYKKWVSQYNGGGKAPLIIKTQEDWPKGLTIQQLEHDIQVHKPDLLVIDQFSLIRHESSDRIGMANTSRRLKELAGKYGIVICLLYQANGDYEKNRNKGEKPKDNSVKELIAPDLRFYSDTISIIQDADVVLGLDSTTWKDKDTGRQQGKALVLVAKSRAGGEGLELDLNWIPNDGIMNTRKPVDLF